MSSRPAQTAIIVVAVGRDASHKLLRPLGQLTVFDRTLHAAMSSDLPVVVVTTAPLAAAAQRHVAARDVVLVPEPAPPAERPPALEGARAPAARQAALFGVGDAIAAGVSARPNASSWLVLPGDMPLVQPDSLRAVARAVAQHPVVFAQHRGRRGHPVGFAGELYSELITLTGEQGARRLLSRYPVFGLELDDPGVLADNEIDPDWRAAQHLAWEQAAPVIRA